MIRMPEPTPILGQAGWNFSHQWSPQALSLWAKSGDEEAQLSLPQHLLDAAGVADQLWVTWIPPKVRQLLSQEIGLSEDDCHRLVVWLAATHDIGKASMPFAGMLDDSPRYRYLGDAVRDSGLNLPGRVLRADYYHHTVAGQVILARWLCNRYGCRIRPADSLAAIAGTHHGLPSFREQVIHAAQHLDKHAPMWHEVHQEIADVMTRFTGADEVLSRFLKSGQRLTDPVQLLLTAIVIVADWIASNAEAFPLGPGARYDQERVEAGMAMINLPPLWNPDDSGLPAKEEYQRSFGWSDDRSPFPVQEAAVEVARKCEKASIMCIEASMGNGKTEASLVAAGILAARLNCSGIMFAAPTMTTSDSLFARVSHWAKLVVNEAVISMYLGHSKNTLNRDFAKMSRMPSVELSEGPSELGDDSTKRALTVAHEWLWGRKKGILSSMVVGTVDQLLFMALQSKHLMLRHLGLAGKVVVIDEVHAYDAYMSSYLEAALEWLGYYEVPVIMLSATLPHSVKAKLIAAYQAGASGRYRRDFIDEVPASGGTYPVITVADADKATLYPVNGATKDLAVTVTPIGDSEEDLRQVLAPVVEGGGCALVLCNTVARAQQTYHEVSQLVGDDACLLHARFTACERVEKERQLLEELGPPKDGQPSPRPKRRIVVATQVVEQSLDLDFDLIVTDIAPIDLLLQRVGRLHRHVRAAGARPAAVSVPHAFVRGVADFGGDARGPVFADALEDIYPRAMLLSTFVALGLEGSGTVVDLPAQIPLLVQDVYGDKVDIPAGWAEDFEDAHRKLEKARIESEKRARTFQLPPPCEAQAFADLWEQQPADIANNASAEQRGFAQVRDTEPTLEVVLCQEVPGGYRPLPWLGPGYQDTVVAKDQPPEPAIAWQLATSTVRLPYRFSKPAVFDRALDQLEHETDAGWQESALLRGQLQLCLDESFEATLANYRLRYDRNLGLIDIEVGAMKGNK